MEERNMKDLQRLEMLLEERNIIQKQCKMNNEERLKIFRQRKELKQEKEL